MELKEIGQHRRIRFGIERKNVLAYAMLVTTMLFWGSAFVGSKIAAQEVTPAVAAVLRFGLGACFLLIFMGIRGKRTRAMTPFSRKLKMLHGVIGVTIYNYLFFWAVHLSYASDGSMIIPTLSPTITILVLTLILKQRLKKQQLIGLIFSLAGSLTFFYVLFFTMHVSHQRVIGDLIFLAAAVFWSMYSILGKKVFQHIEPLPATAYGMAFGTFILGIYAAPDLIKIQWSQLSLQFWLIQLYLGLFPTFIAYLFFNHGIQQIGSARASTFMYIVPVSGLILSAVILAEFPTSLQLIGAALMITGVWIINR